MTSEPEEVENYGLIRMQQLLTIACRDCMLGVQALALQGCPAMFVKPSNVYFALDTELVRFRFFQERIYKDKEELTEDDVCAKEPYYNTN